MKQSLPDEAIVKELYLLALCRRPTGAELDLAKKHLAAYTTDQSGAVQDLMWALLNSRDFLLVH